MKPWKHSFKNLRFRQKLILSYMVVVLVPLLLLGLYSYYQSLELLQKQAIQGARETAATVAGGINDNMVRYERIFDSIVLNPEVQRFFGRSYTDLTELSSDLKKNVDPFFTMVTHLNKDVSQVTVFTKSGIPEYGNTIQSFDKALQAVWYEQASRQKKTFWYYRQGEFAAVKKFPNIYVHEDTALLYLKLDPSHLLDTTTIGNAEHYGFVLSDHNQNMILEKAMPNAAQSGITPQELIRQKDGFFSKDGVSYIVLTQNIPIPDWTLHYYIPAKQLSVDATSIIKATIVVVAVCTFILFVLIWLFSRTLLYRIQLLHRWAKQVELGDLRVSAVSDDHRDEIGELTRRFGKMLQRINELIDETYKSKITQKELQLKALQSQINPHFLYNSLSIINWKSVEIGARDISHFVTTLSKFYRTALNRGESLTSIRDEITNTQSYIQIQSVMHDYEFDIIYEIDETILPYSTVNLTLQPLVENAIIHGIDMKTEGKAELIIRGKRNNGDIEFSVEDNGPGIDEELQKELLSRPSKGYGLKNVHERIQITFGEQYGIQIFSEKGRGTVMKLVIPIRAYE
ncbi:HAMP domain-containing protein [Paenibacillus sp. LMG 31456]|uniref:histidine kinase n=1 Tax=Paenibacillus foliorum TaxID=2654974 RepID=A0A972K3W8_9BACL|nr:sensor histidine kinase [Paenibacillus foliorum]NOU98256.1 HAMP domain-containing protein [Paenibacillus foliorum]